MRNKWMMSLCCGAAMLACVPSAAQQNVQPEPMQTGKYQPAWESLAAYECPDWFRDAKFGIWAHWGPQCEPESGDWYARHMYYPGHWQYDVHVKKYGNPKDFGFKDVINEWKAEEWQPDSLVRFYKSVGARYFMALGNHHDNMDLWDSKYQPWNSVNMGPKRDVVGEWAKACKKYGLPLGVSIHASHAWTWMEGSQDFDGKLTKADGKGKWWEGYDPQDLYAQNHPMSEKSWANNRVHVQWAWSGGACLPTLEYVTNFYDRTLDAINRYNPDLIYFDVTVAPFHDISDCGLKIASHFYNKNPRAVMFGKMLNDEQREALTWDVERGAPNEIVEEPWQTCNCLGNWHYNTSIYERGSYKSATEVIKQLIDIVSKNGNLLLSIPLRADGTYDEKEAAILDGIEAWMTVNKESIFNTRPWVRFGEGPVAESDIKLKAQGFNDGMYSNMTSADIRFNQTKKYLYVTPLGWPEDGKVVVRSLAKGNPHFKVLPP